jgi:hypothetical protein
MRVQSEGVRVNRNEKALAWLLRASAVLLLTALIPVVMPFAWMERIHAEMGMGELPNTIIVAYLTRSLSLMYAMHGSLELFVSFNVRRHLPVIRCLAVLGILFGISMLALDCAVGMPWFWTIGEGPFIAGLGVVLMWLSRGVNPTPA